MYEIVNVQYTGTYNNGGTNIPAVLGEFRATTAADLPAQNVDCHIICGCDGLDIATGDRYIWNGSSWIRQPSDRAFSNVYTKAEIDTMINAIYQTMMYYHTAQESANGSITFYTLGTHVGSLTIYGNGEQTRTPAPAAPITPKFVGTLDGADWTIPITCAGQTAPVYLGEVQTTRKIRKLMLTGEEDFSNQYGESLFSLFLLPLGKTSVYQSFCTHYKYNPVQSGLNVGTVNGEFALQLQSTQTLLAFKDTNYTSPTDFKSYLAQQYASGTPVTVWYVLAEPQTGIVNEPLAKIGDYADKLHINSEDVSIPTVSGENTLTVDTTLPPSKIIISGE